MSASDSADQITSDDLAAYALNALDEERRALVEARLGESETLRLELEEFEETAASLAFAVPEITPPDSLKEGLLRRLDEESRSGAATEPVLAAVSAASAGNAEADASSRAGASDSDVGAETRGWIASPAVAWSVSGALTAALVLLVATSTVMFIRLNDRVTDLSARLDREAESVQTVSQSVREMEDEVDHAMSSAQEVSQVEEATNALEQKLRDQRWLQYALSTGTWTSPSWFSGAALQEASPQGMLVAHNSDGRALLMVDGLPPPPAGKVYQVWLFKGDEPSPGSTFTVDRHGYAVVELQFDGETETYSGAQVTMEPAGGSEAPTGDPVLIQSSP
ncbi:MAG: anti-sigma factor domain-containing protein [Chloroflexota bacterium]